MSSRSSNENRSKVSKRDLLIFVPVIHAGYIDFIKKNSGDVWVFGRDIINDYVHLTRDLRMIDPKDALKSLQKIFPKRKIAIVDKKTLAGWPYEEVTMPDDEVCRDIEVRYLKDKKVTYSNIFLRWNKIITFKEHEIGAHRKITKDSFHRELMRHALANTEKSSDWWRQIACLIVKDGKILYETHNHHLPTDFHLSVNGDPRSNFDAGQHLDIYTSIHAEAEAIAKAAREGKSLDGATIYSTTFPCPNCARLIGTAGIKKLYYSRGYSLLDAEKIMNHFGMDIIMVDDREGQ